MIDSPCIHRFIQLRLWNPVLAFAVLWTCLTSAAGSVAYAQSELRPERECNIGYGRVTVWIDGLNWQASSCPDGRSLMLSFSAEGDMMVFVYVGYSSGRYDVQGYGVDLGGVQSSGEKFARSLSDRDIAAIIARTNRKN